MDDLTGLSRTRQVLRGARFALGGIRLVVTHPSLWSYLLAPALLTTTAFFLLCVAAFPGFGYLLGLVWSPSADTSWWVSLLWYGFWFAVRLSVVATGALVLYFTSSIIATPFYDRLSEHVETMMLGPYDEPFSWRQALGDLKNSVVHSVLSLSLWLSVMVASLVLNLLPVAGSVLSFAIGVGATTMFVARESMDGAMSRRRMRYRHKLQVLAAHPWLMLGFGAVVATLLWIPLLNFVILPMAVAGGTVMFCQLEKLRLVPHEDGRLGFTSARHRVQALADRALTEEFALPQPDPARTVVRLGSATEQR